MRNSAAIRGAVCAGLGLLFAATLNAGPASAQLHTYVSKASGSSDANPCSRFAPCVTFAAAYSKVAPLGQIDVIDPGDYGALTIGKSITIDGGGMDAVVTASGNVFVINAGTSDIVTIRNIRLQGTQAANTGIQIMAAGKVNIEHVTINQFTAFGINDQRSTSGGFLFVADAIIRSSNNGIWMQPSGGSINAVLRQVDASSNSNSGIAASGVTFASVRDCTVGGNGVGLAAFGGAELNVESCAVFSNTTGLSNGGLGASTMRVSNSAIYENTTGLQNVAGAIQTYGNNRVGGNSAGNSGVMVPASPGLQ
jgi:hypothetical protein